MTLNPRLSALSSHVAALNQLEILTGIHGTRKLLATMAACMASAMISAAAAICQITCLEFSVGDTQWIPAFLQATAQSSRPTLL